MGIRTQKGFILSEVVAATAIVAVAVLTLSAGLIIANYTFDAAKAVTKGRFLAQSHLEMASVGLAPLQLEDGDLVSTLTELEVQGETLYKVEVTGPRLPKPLSMVGGP